jgi:serine/threonine protein kinase/formylglycine-generating enzyme required for sulfatase activity
MSESDFEVADDIDVDLLRRIDGVCSEFDRQWRAGLAPRIEDFLGRIPAGCRDRGLRDLVEQEVDLRRKEGEAAEIQSYLARFPGDETIVRDAFTHVDSTLVASVAGHIDPLASHSSRSKDEVPACLGRFPIRKQIGKGAFGVVYLATDPVFPRLVALKVPRAERVQTEEQRRAFLRDAQIAATLNHPGVLTIYEIDTTGDQPFIVQEYMPGGDLKRRIAEGNVTCEQAVAWMIPIAETVAGAHEKNIFHRDLKPANILLDGRGRPRVADFGLALHERDQQNHREEFAGTLPYMSPEQVRRESNRLDGRADTWSLGVIFYEMLTGRRPFLGSTDEIADQIKYRDPRPPREINHTLPAELERICLKCLEKPVAQRYSTLTDLAHDLRHWQLEGERKESAALKEEPRALEKPPRIVPKGLRSFDARDSDFFLELLPGPRDRYGLPEGIRFWKALIEESDPSRTFTVGVLHGPSGCGKSSFVKAGLVPKLGPQVAAVFVEATALDTEERLRRGVRNACIGIPDELPLTEVLAGIRDGNWNPHGKKILVVLDQFEQWLHAGNLQTPAQLVDALRHCDGEHLQCLVLVREDFWTGISRFMQALEIPIQEQRNAALVDRFDPFHARHVLEQFGRAYGRLPDHPAELTREQHEFVDAAVDELSEEGRVICMRLALFSDLFKGKPWTPGALHQAGGAAGLGVTFLEETFAARSAPEAHRRHLPAVQKLFAKLLPGPDTDIKGSMQTRDELQQACGYAAKPRAFDELIQILDEQLRLVTPTDPEGSFEPDEPDRGSAASSPQYYQFTHDYLIPSVRNWLKLKDGETASGRARQVLIERASLWNSRPQDRHLPSLWEHARIRLLTSRQDRTASQQKMLRSAARAHGTKAALAMLLFAAVLWGAYETTGRLRTENMVRTITSADMSEQERLIDGLSPYGRWAVPMLTEIAASDRSESEKLKAALALSALTEADSARIEYLVKKLLDAPPEHALVIARILGRYKAEMTDRLWEALDQPVERQHRLRAAVALALWDPDSDRWQDQDRGSELAGELVQAPALESATWIAGLRPVGGNLAGHLEKFLKDRSPERVAERSIAAAALADYLAAEPERLVELLLLADNEREFLPFVEKLRPRREQVEPVLTAIFEQPISEKRYQSIRNKEWKRRAVAGVCLVQLGEGTRVWEELRETNNRSLSSLLIHQFYHLGTPFSLLADRLDVKTDAVAQQALILSLGEFDLPKITAQKDRVVQKLVEWHREDKDAGIHSAAEWTLRQWVAFKPLGETAAEEKDWFVNSQGQTMLIVHGPVTFEMGDLAEQDALVKTVLPYSFAIATHEVTVAQFQKFRKTQVPSYDDTYTVAPVPPADCPMNDVTWHDAAAYCNWLSKQGGIDDPSEWCYEPDETGRPAERMRIAANWQERKGYRLPTEAEWEYVCRADSNAPYAYGEPVELLAKYAWYVANSVEGKSRFRMWEVGRLKPNGFGAFDMHGHVWEWCHDEEVDAGPSENVPADGPRGALRGGSIEMLPQKVTTPSRLLMGSGVRRRDYGFRLAITLRE